MANLPPKPVSSPTLPPRKDDDERRSRRPLSREDRVYVPSRPARLHDSYVAPYDREDRHAGRYRDNDWERRSRDARDRYSRAREGDRDYYRRRDDTYIAPEDRRGRRPPSPRRSDRSYRSRSPRGRRPHSPVRYPPRFAHSRSPPPKRSRYVSRSLSRSPRSPRRRRSRSRSRTPEKRRGRSRESTHHLNGSSPVKPGLLSSSISYPENTSTTVGSPRRNQGETKGDRVTNVMESKLATSHNIPDAISHKPDEKQIGNAQQHQHPTEPFREHEAEFKARERTPSPPRQPRFMNNQSMRDGAHGRRGSRSPPRAPRPFQRSSLTQNTAGLYTGRRPVPGVSLTTDSKKIEKLERPNVTSAVDVEIARLESHRASLATEYVQLAKNARRALHELDMAMLDLRAAEARRKVAASQLEKARVGMLGIDATVANSPVI